MTALDFSGVFEEEEKEEVAVKDQQVQSTAASSGFSGVFDEEEPEDIPEPTREPSIEETPEDIYQRGASRLQSCAYCAYCRHWL